MQKAERAEPVIDRHDDNILLARETYALGPWRRTPSRDKRAAVQPQHHRPPPIVERRGPEVEHEAILVHRERRVAAVKLEDLGRRAEGVLSLHRARAVLERVADAGPRLRRHRWTPAARALRRAAVRNPLEGADAVIDRAANFSTCDFGNYVGGHISLRTPMESGSSKF